MKCCILSRFNEIWGSDLMTRIQSRYEQLSTTIETAVRGIHKFVRWVNAVISGKDFDYHQKISDGDREGHVASDKVVEMLPGKQFWFSCGGLKRCFLSTCPEKLACRAWLSPLWRWNSETLHRWFP